jgi:RNA polymerase sigma factor FliA
MAKQSETEAQALWARYRTTGDTRLRDRLVMRYLPLVRHIVYRKMREVPSHYDVDDFISCGIEAVIVSIDRYDPSKRASLEQFVWTRIQGAVLDELRRRDWAPRSVRRWERESRAARKEFFCREGREPSRAELAELLGCTIDEVREQEEKVTVADLTSLNVIVQEEDTEVERVETLVSDELGTDPDHHATVTHAQERLHWALDQLPQREREVATMLYGKHMQLKDVGKHLGVSESRVSQINSEMTRRLRTLLTADEALFAELA